ncbi:MAG: copper chaperone PCu(A)C [Casimicrobiaceae bacterium]|nr:copper chaperone PCu(A)C [Casimicrobiaceae bacterium]
MTAQAQVSISDPWVRATAPGQRAAGAFMEIKAEQNVRLVAGRSPAAAKVEIHEMAMEGGVMKMREIPGIDIPQGQTLSLKPGGYHVMLIDLKQPIKADEVVPITLEFVGIDNKKHTVEVKARGRAMTAMSPGAQGKAEAMSHGAHKH